MINAFSEFQQQSHHDHPALLSTDDSMICHPLLKIATVCDQLKVDKFCFILKTKRLCYLKKIPRFYYLLKIVIFCHPQKIDLLKKEGLGFLNRLTTGKTCKNEKKKYSPCATVVQIYIG